MKVPLGVPYVTGYPAFKSAMHEMVQILATEVLAERIRVKSVTSIWTDTPMQKAIECDDERKKFLVGRP
ncbi:SDR family oxidoreductase [Serpentinicella alkaliphila]|uniref:Enoyl-ACP reductase-like protein n=1 Tax=Serpentinicella alkaliphila TaxID=1734049 RepID=A0A4R2TNZ9_9FIRM|nr:SDR family oxidoreductase [Serpentinicella alkaliphila]QUH27135.1 SDR family oxidoreductase [Serpentinicella alkaliphila]TCQ05271.1 enoyl-ACP reductase-like protein [Serpentinicella alkaliphila]